MNLLVDLIANLMVNSLMANLMVNLMANQWPMMAIDDSWSICNGEYWAVVFFSRVFYQNVFGVVVAMDKPMGCWDPLAWDTWDPVPRDPQGFGGSNSVVR